MNRDEFRLAVVGKKIAAVEFRNDDGIGADTESLNLRRLYLENGGIVSLSGSGQVGVDAAWADYEWEFSVDVPSLWIPFTPLTMPPDGMVLVCQVFDRGRPFQSKRIMVAWWHGGDQVWRWQGGRLTGEVTHWMPLPELPGLD